MDGITRSKHFDTRFQQRGITSVVAQTLLNYGAGRKTRDGAESLSFTREVLAEIKADLGPHIFKMCERLKNAYIVVSDEGALITVARSYRKVLH